MSITANIEWKIESAFISVLGAVTDLSAFDVQRWKDGSKDTDPPKLTVETNFARDETWSVRADNTDALVDLRVYTSRYNDTTGVTAANAIGAIRDTIYGDRFLPDMSAAVTGFHLYGIEISEGVANLDTDTRRIRQMTVRCHATSQDIAENSSSSSSSSP